MKLPTVISIGESLIDRLGPPGGDPALDKPTTDCFGGAPANVACALSRLGVNVSLISSLGNDHFGQQFLNLMLNRGVTKLGLQTDILRPTRIVLVRRDLSGERYFGGFEGDKGFGFADQAISLEKIIKDWPLISEKAKWLVTGTIPLASEISSKAFLWCIQNALERGINIALDLNWRPTFWRDELLTESSPSSEELRSIKSILEKVSLIKLAKEEAQWFFNSFDPKEISKTLNQNPSVIITDGANPVSWFLNTKSGKTKAISSSSVIDTTGAGDAFTAGLIYKLLSFNLDEMTQAKGDEIIKFAIACGAIVCEGVGAIDPQPYLSDVEKLLFKSNGGMSSKERT